MTDERETLTNVQGTLMMEAAANMLSACISMTKHTLAEAMEEGLPLQLWYAEQWASIVGNRGDSVPVTRSDAKLFLEAVAHKCLEILEPNDEVQS